MRKSSILLPFLVVGLCFCAPSVAPLAEEVRAQSAATGASVETKVQGNQFSTQVVRAVSGDTTGTQTSAMNVGAPAESRQREEKKDTNPQAPKAPTNLRIIRAN